MHQVELPYSWKKALAHCLLSIALLLFVLPAQLRPSSFLHDDAYFYLQVASNILRGNGSTFHNITPTNGYHPLWMLFSILGLLITGNDKLLGLNVVFGLQALLFLGTAYYFRRIAKVISDDYWLVGVIILAIYSFSTAIYASEAHLNACTLMMSVYYFLLALEDDTSSNWVKAGILSGLSVLARLDNVFVIGSLFSLVLVSHQERAIERALNRFLVVASSFTCIVAPYLLYNYSLYGHFVPISGTIKSTFPVVTGNIQNLGRLGQGTAVFGLLSVVSSFDRGLSRAQRTLLRILGIGVLLHASYVVLYTNHYTFWRWYYVSGVVNLAFFSDAVFQRFVSSLQKYAGGRFVTAVRNLSIVTLALVGIGRGWLKAYNPNSIGPFPIPQINEYRWPDEFAVWMRENLPPGSTVFVHDWPGAIAYYSDLQILPMDGLMNDFRYNDDLLSQGINRYLCTKGVRYFFGPEEPSENGLREFEILAPLYRQPVGAIRLLDENLVVRVKDVVNYPQETPPLAIWRIDPCSDAS
jgi:hypothetical protein